MRTLLLIGLCFVTGNVARADEPRMVRVSIRVVEIDGVKLKQAGLKYPVASPEQIGPPEAEPTLTPEFTGVRFTRGGFVQFGTVPELTAAFQPLLQKGCAQVIARPSITIASGQEALFAEFAQPTVGEQDLSAPVGPNTRAAGFSLQVLPKVIDLQRIELDVKYALKREAPPAAIQLFGPKIPDDVTTNMMNVKAGLKPGVTVAIRYPRSGSENGRQIHRAPHLRRLRPGTVVRRIGPSVPDAVNDRGNHGVAVLHFGKFVRVARPEQREGRGERDRACHALRSTSERATQMEQRRYRAGTRNRTCAARRLRDTMAVCPSSHLLPLRVLFRSGGGAIWLRGRFRLAGGGIGG